MNNSNYESHFGLITPDHYHHDDFFTFEIGTEFEPSWLSEGFPADWQNYEGYVTTQIGKRAIVVQNFQGALQAFQNFSLSSLIAKPNTAML